MQFLKEQTYKIKNKNQKNEEENKTNEIKTKYKLFKQQKKNLHQEIGALSNIFRSRNQTLCPLMIPFVELSYGCRSTAQ